MDRSKSITLLNAAVADELLAVHQYMYFHFHLDDQGFGPISMLFKQTAIEEMMHVERLADRILFLKGEVEMVAAANVVKILEPVDMLKKAMEMEEASQVFYNKASVECGNNADSVTKQLFEQLTADEERHFDQYEKQLEKIEKFGPSYLALQSFNTAPEPGAQTAAKA